MNGENLKEYFRFNSGKRSELLWWERGKFQYVDFRWIFNVLLMNVPFFSNNNNIKLVWKTTALRSSAENETVLIAFIPVYLSNICWKGFCNIHGNTVILCFLKNRYKIKSGDISKHCQYFKLTKNWGMKLVHRTLPRRERTENYRPYKDIVS